MGGFYTQRGGTLSPLHCPSTAPSGLSGGGLGVGKWHDRPSISPLSPSASALPQPASSVRQNRNQKGQSFCQTKHLYRKTEEVKDSSRLGVLLPCPCSPGPPEPPAHLAVTQHPALGSLACCLSLSLDCVCLWGPGLRPGCLQPSEQGPTLTGCLGGTYKHHLSSQLKADCRLM